LVAERGETMAEGKDRGTITLLTEAWEDWQTLTLEKRGVLITAIMLYQRGEEVPQMDAETAAVFRPICRGLDAEYEKHLRHLETQRANGRKGGRPRKAATSSAEAKKPVRVEIPDDIPKKPAERLVAVVDDGFEAWWKEYPKKVGKGDARKSWCRIKPGKALQETMLKTLRAARESDQWKADGGKYIPNPSTWLNQERWTDDVSTYTRRAVRQTSFHNVESRPDDDLEAWALRKQLAELREG